MAKETQNWFMVTVVLLIFISRPCVYGLEQQVPCFFIFGDSLSDNGNNNLLMTSAKVNYPPYGIDYPNGPTGRFTNGQTMVDILAKLLGFNNPIPPFATARGPEIVKGVNYASGGAGIRAETGSKLGAVISFDRQLLNHGATVSRIASELRRNRASTLNDLNKCLYSVSIGANDYINNYFMPQFYNSSRQYTPEKYAASLITQYSGQIQTLYKNYGARKVALVGVAPIGCTPYEISKTKGTACVQEMNNAAQLFNQKLVSLVDDLNNRFTDAKFIYVNTTGISSGDPTSAGFKVWNVGCCPVNEFGQCVSGGIPCPNRNEYVFWDSFHPTEASNRITASRVYKSFEPTDNYPMDVSHLVQLKL